ncbi:MAG: hypothetical protein GY757_52600 [bacterium]|nr:hypothetical protein [bacterium]
MKNNYSPIFTRSLILFLAAGFCLLFQPVTVTAASTSEDVIFEAMTDELSRSMKSLKIENMEAPYYIEYIINDSSSIDIKGSFGSLKKSTEEKKRGIVTNLRVGSYQQDNSEFIDKSSLFRGIAGNVALITVENDYDAIRHEIWLQTDKAYKQALKQLTNKKAFLENKKGTEIIADFSKEKKVTSIGTPTVIKMDRKKWEKIVSRLSAVFQKYPGIHDSSIDMQAVVRNKYYVNSEGSKLLRPGSLVSIIVAATTRSADGILLKHHVPFYALNMEQLPTEKELFNGVEAMAKELSVLAKAPVLESYIGPVLFTGKASPQLFAEVMVPHFSGARAPLSNMGQMAAMMKSSELAQRLNRKVLPSELTIIDDPTKTSFKSTPLIGSFKVDIQAVPAQAVTLVEEGKLKALLMSRRPTKKIPNSNGHARMDRMAKVAPQIGNLFISTTEGKSTKELKEELIQYCKDQGLEFGLIVKSLDNPMITGREINMATLMSGGAGMSNLSNPVMMYKVHVKDGREELVRGLAFNNVSLKELKDITAVGKDSYVLHRMQANGGGFGGGFFAMIMAARSGQKGTMGVPGSIIAPPVLFEELELKKKGDTRKDPPLMIHPYFSKK